MSAPLCPSVNGVQLVMAAVDSSPAYMSSKRCPKSEVPGDNPRCPTQMARLERHQYWPTVARRATNRMPIPKLLYTKQPEPLRTEADGTAVVTAILNGHVLRECAPHNPYHSSCCALKILRLSTSFGSRAVVVVQTLPSSALMKTCNWRATGASVREGGKKGEGAVGVLQRGHRCCVPRYMLPNGQSITARATPTAVPA